MIVGENRTPFHSVLNRASELDAVVGYNKALECLDNYDLVFVDKRLGEWTERDDSLFKEIRRRTSDRELGLYVVVSDFNSHYIDNIFHSARAGADYYLRNLSDRVIDNIREKRWPYE